MLFFLQFKELEFYWEALVAHFHRFLKSNCSDDFSHDKTGNGTKKRVVLWRKIVPLQF